MNTKDVVKDALNAGMMCADIDLESEILAFLKHIRRYGLDEIGGLRNTLAAN